jgi:hypothetical protein
MCIAPWTPSSNTTFLFLCNEFMPMTTQIDLNGGPYDGPQTFPQQLPATIGLPVDENFCPSKGDLPFAIAIYRREPDNSQSKYKFMGFQRTDGLPFTAEFEDGPITGQREVPQPVRYGPREVHVPLSQDGTKFDGRGQPFAVAIYERRLRGEKWKYVFSHVEESGEKLDSVKYTIAVSRAKNVARNFYLCPNYDVYSKPPTGDHVQDHIEHAHRRAHVDKGIAQLIVGLWENDLDTLGSCQERPSGKAYVGFPVPGEGEKFHDLLKKHGIESELKSTTTTIRNAETGETQELGTANVLFPPNSIDQIVTLLQESRDKST